MQNTMKNMMDEFMKNMSSFQTFDFSKQADLFKDMNNTAIGLQFLDFQKTAFNNTYNTMIKIQEQSEKLADSFMKENASIPAEGQKLLSEWRAVFKKSQTEFKKTIDDSFKQAEGMLNETKKEAKSS